MNNNLFTTKDFDTIKKFAGQPKSNFAQGGKDPELEPLKAVYKKFKTLLDALSAKLEYRLNKFGTGVSAMGNANKIDEYRWARLYPAFTKDEDQICYSVSINENGIDWNISEYKGGKESICNRHFTVNEVCQMSLNDLVSDFEHYTNQHYADFIKFGAKFGVNPFMQKLQEIQMEEYKNLLLNNRNLILTGAPGTGKTYLAKKIAEDLGATAENKRLDFVQFHPSYDYTDFVEGLRPIKKGDAIGFEREDGIFMAFCRKALADKDNKYVFIIDEINRGEMSKILGELFFSIDPGYRGIDGKIRTQYSNLWDEKAKFDESDVFYIPQNVYIIGTMNDIDRSVESMDFAMRRRFAFKEVKAADRQNMIDECEGLKEIAPEIKTRMDNLNKAIDAAKLGSAYHIGGAYFLKLKNYLNSADPWKDLWENHLKGLLIEYFRGDPKQEDYLRDLEDAYYK